MNEKKIIEIQINLADGITEIAELQKRITELTAANKANDKSTNDLKNAYAENTVKIKDYRSQLNLLIKESANQARTDLVKIGHIQKLKAEVSNLTLQYERLSKEELSSTAGKQVLENLKTKREELSKLNEAYGNYQLGVGQYARATNNLSIQLGMVMKELPNFAISARTGIMSLTNNLPMLAEAFKAVKLQQAEMIEQGKKATSMFSLITKSIFGVTGIVSIAMVLLQLFNKQIVDWVTGLFKGKEATDQATVSLKNFNKTIKDGNSLIKNAITEVQTVETAFRQYKKGIITADEALVIFNENLGDNLGAHQDIETAMQAFNALAPKYIEWSLKMAIAEKAKETAADLALKRISAEMQKDEEYLKWYEKWAIWYNKTINGVDLSEEYYFNQSDKRRKAAVSAAKEEEDAYSDLYKTLSDEAQSFAKQWGLITKEIKPVTPEDVSDPKTTAALNELDNKFFLMREKYNALISDMFKNPIPAQVNIPAISLDIEQFNNMLSDLGIQYTRGIIDYNTFIEEKLKLFKLALDSGLSLGKENYEEFLKLTNEYNNKEDEADKMKYSRKRMIINQFASEATSLFNSIGDLMSNLDERELQSYAKTIEGKANYDELYAQKKYELEYEAAKRQKSIGIFNTMIDTAKAIMSVWGDATLPTAAKIIFTALAGAQGVIQTAAIAAQPLPVAPSGKKGSSINTSKTTVTEKFHTGTYRPATPTEEQEITRTLLTTERVLSPSQTAIFDNIISRVQSYGGSQAITNGVGVSDTLAEQRMEMAFTRALRNMPNPVMSWTEYTNQAQRQKLLDRNTKFG